MRNALSTHGQWSGVVRAHELVRTIVRAHSTRTGKDGGDTPADVGAEGRPSAPSATATVFGLPTARLTASSTQRALRDVTRVMKARAATTPAGGRASAHTRERESSQRPALDLADLFYAKASPQPPRHTAHMTTSARPDKPRASLLSSSSSSTPPESKRRATAHEERRADADKAPRRQTAAVPSAFIAKLASTVAAKRLDWAAIVDAHPELTQLPIIREREYWMKHYCCLNSADPVLAPRAMADEGRRGIAANRRPPAVLMCAADTGTGKSVLVPLFLLDAHWAALAERLTRTQAQNQPAAPNTGGGSGDDAAAQAPPLLPLSSLASFAEAFRQCSRVCIFVSQPTRVACVEMAQYTAAVLAASDMPRDQTGRPALPTNHFLGKRIGYAVGGEGRFSAETEILFATPGYILNVLQHQHSPQAQLSSSSSPRALQPTTLIIDEAHCRELETDLLLAWAKMHLRARSKEDSGLLLRQVVVMSATMDIPAMLDYLQGRRLTTATAAARAAGEGDQRSAAGDAAVQLLLFAPQRAQLAKLLQPTSSHVAAQASWNAAAVRLLAVQQHERYVALLPPSSSSPASLRREEQRTFVVEEYFIADLTSRFVESEVLFGPWTKSGHFHLPQPQQRSLESRDSAFAGKALANDQWLPRPRRKASTRSEVAASIVAGASAAARSRSSGSATIPALLTADGQRTFNSLQHFYSLKGLRHSVFHFQQAVTVALFILQLLQAVRLRWGGPAPHPEAAEAAGPLTVLVFLPGFGEIQLLQQCLERFCSRVAAEPPAAAAAAAAAAAGAASGGDGEVRREPCAPLSGGEPITVLQYGDEVFSVPVLHSAAVGSPQEHLAASAACGAPLRLVLASSVAESSLTIPNVKVVVDSALERYFAADPATGTMTKTTSLVSLSSLRQRSGRAGRTCDGVVLHLAPRELFLPPQLPHHHHHHRLAPLRESPAATLLRVKALFAGTKASEVLSSLPAPPSPIAMETAYALLLDMDLLLPSPGPVYSSSSSSSGNAVPPKTAAECSPSGDRPPPVSSQVSSRLLYTEPLARELDESILSRKGRVVAALPIPLEQALLIFHAFQFACVEDAVLMACAMTVPSVVLAPRVMPYKSESAAAAAPTTSSSAWTSSTTDAATTAAWQSREYAPLDQFHKHLWVQRQLAGFPVPTRSGGDERRGEPLTPEESTGGLHLSEPLLLRALLLRWYTCVTQEDVHHFMAHFSIHRSALRSVDVSVAQCCQRLIQLLNVEEDALDAQEASEEEAARSTLLSSNEADSSDYYTFHELLDQNSRPRANERRHSWQQQQEEDQAGRRQSLMQTPAPSRAAAAGSLSEFLIDPTWPRAYRRRLVRSLQRLRHAALARATQRQGAASRGMLMPQWFSPEADLAKLFERHFLSAERYEATGSGGAEDESGAAGGHPDIEAMLRKRQAELMPRAAAPAVARKARQQALQQVLASGSLSFTLGSLQDRLCAAFTAAFARQTLCGEDGGYRRHHRRLTRNWPVLHDDVDHTCTFSLECRRPPSAGLLLSTTAPGAAEATAVGNSELALTPSVVRTAMAPFLAGTGCLQLELFSSGRAAAAVRFASLGFRGLVAPSTTAKESAPLSTVVTGEEKPPEGRQGGSNSCNSGDGHDDSDDDENARLVAGIVRYERDITGDRSLRDAGAPAVAAAAREWRLFSDGNAVVRLAPFGVSVLTAAQSALQRMSVDVDAGDASRQRQDQPPHEDNQSRPLRRGPVSVVAAVSSGPSGSPLRESSSAGVGFAGSGEALSVTWAERSGAAQRLRRRDVESLGMGHLFPSVAAEPENTVTGTDSSNSSSSSSGGRVGGRSDAAGSAEVPSAAPVAAAPSLMEKVGGPMLLSVLPPINVSGGVHWRVGLPSVASLWLARRPPSSPVSGAGAGGGRAVSYCDVCHCLVIGAKAMAQHCRTAPHLSHLLFSVQHGVTQRDWLALRGCGDGVVGEAAVDHSACGSTGEGAAGVRLMTSLVLQGSGRQALSAAADPTSPLRRLPAVAVEAHPCRVHAHSFLNALQWRVQGGQGPPLAIAGGLLSAPPSHTILHRRGESVTDGVGLPPAEQEADDPWAGLQNAFYGRYVAAAAGGARAAGALTALHVWVLNLSVPSPTPRAEVSGSGSTAGTPAAVAAAARSGAAAAKAVAATPATPSTALFVLAGYISGSSTQYPTALLFNQRHTHVHGIMLYGCGVWRLPQPLSVEGVLGVLEAVGKGRGWPGLVTSLSCTEGGALAPEARSGTDGDGYDGLHWCPATATCPGTTCDVLPEEEEVSSPSPAGRPSSRRRPRPLASACGTTTVDATAVAAAVLLTLHEYLAARRNMVVYSDFVERLIAKLDHRPVSTAFVEGGDASTAGGRSNGAQQLCAFLSNRYQARDEAALPYTLHDVLRDLGCQFASPPAAVAGLLYEPSVHGEAPPPQGSTAEGVADQGLSRVLETRFTLPPILPSRLPVAGFGALLRQLMLEQRRRDGTGGDAEAGSKRAGVVF